MCQHQICAKIIFSFSHFSTFYCGKLIKTFWIWYLFSENFEKISCLYLSSSLLFHVLLTLPFNISICILFLSWIHLCSSAIYLNKQHFYTNFNQLTSFNCRFWKMYKSKYSPHQQTPLSLTIKINKIQWWFPGNFNYKTPPSFSSSNLLNHLTLPRKKYAAGLHSISSPFNLIQSPRLFIFKFLVFLTAISHSDLNCKPHYHHSI